MFRGLINDAKDAAGSVVAKQAARASVVVPFIIAAGFATAVVAMTLVERFGHRTAYLILAGGFCAIGVVAALLVRSKEQEEVVADEKAAEADTAVVATETVVAAAEQLPLALIGSILSHVTGPVSVASVGRIVVRNLPLLVLLAGAGFLVWPKAATEAAVTDSEQGLGPAVPRSNGVDHSAYHHTPL